MPPWIGPVTIGLGTVGLSTSPCEPAAGPLPSGLEAASALPAVMSPTASAAPTTARVRPPDARPVIASPSSERRTRGARRGLRHRSSIPCSRIVDFEPRRSDASADGLVEPGLVLDRVEVDARLASFAAVDLEVVVDLLLVALFGLDVLHRLDAITVAAAAAIG